VIAAGTDAGGNLPPIVAAQRVPYSKPICAPRTVLFDEHRAIKCPAIAAAPLLVASPRNILTVAGPGCRATTGAAFFFVYLYLMCLGRSASYVLRADPLAHLFCVSPSATSASICATAVLFDVRVVDQSFQAEGQHAEVGYRVGLGDALGAREIFLIRASNLNKSILTASGEMIATGSFLQSALIAKEARCIWISKNRSIGAAAGLRPSR
jgi:hypothetical protein